MTSLPIRKVLLIALATLLLLIAERLLDKVLNIRIPPRMALVLIIALVLCATVITIIPSEPPYLPTPTHTLNSIPVMTPTAPATITLTFTPVQPVLMPAILAIAISSTSDVYWALDAEGALYYSSDGYDWIRRGRIGEATLYPYETHLIIEGFHNIVIATREIIYFSEDEGYTWRNMPTPWGGAPLNDLRAGLGGRIYAATEKGFYRIERTGISVREDLGLSAYIATSIYQRENALYVAVNDLITGESCLYRLYGGTFSCWMPIGKDEVVLSFRAFDQENVVILLKDGRVLVAGQKALPALGVVRSGVILDITPLDVLTLADDQLWRGTSDGWHPLTVPECDEPLVIATTPDEDKWLLGCNNGLFISKDQGLTWRKGVIRN